MPRIVYLPENMRVEVEEGAVILETSLQAGIPHMHACGGNARCSTCRVLVTDGLDNCGERNSSEQAIAQRLRFDPCVRLACQTQVVGEGDVTVRRLVLDAEDVAAIKAQVRGKIAPTGGEEKHVAILFADLRGFTTLSEKLLPYDVIDLLNRYFRRMGHVIHRYGGTINNYMGDGLMALFGLHHPERAAEYAVRAGLEMIEALEALNPYVESLYRQKLQIGIGIHYGSVVIGDVGATDNRRLTAIGDAVNFASRIESANKEFGSMLLVSESVYDRVRDRVEFNRQKPLQLKGKSGEYTLYEITGITPSDCPIEFPSAETSKSPLSRFWIRIQKCLQGVLQKL